MKFYIFHKRRLSSLRIKLDEDGKQYTMYISQKIYVRKPIFGRLIFTIRFYGH